MPTLEWIGKDKVINHHQDVPFRVLDKKYSFDSNGQTDSDSDSENMIIRGDNLEALKALLPRYEGMVKCIYIDPPYNTGNENWIYNDSANDPKIKKWLGQVVGKEGEDLSRHDKWLCMMYPRLKLLYHLLAEDGAIFISIDDNEQANLKLICDEIFGSRNFVANVIWQKRLQPDMRTTLGAGHDYIITYAKNIFNFKQYANLLAPSEEQKSRYKNPDNDPNGAWVSADFMAKGYRPNQMYEITTPSGKKYKPREGSCWRNIEPVYLKLVSEGKIWFGKDGSSVPRRKTYLSEVSGIATWTWWPNKEVGHTQEATKEIIRIFNNPSVFDYPKPARLIERILQIASDPDSIILDSFAGSGTTAHAVLNINKQDGGNRRFILVEMEDYADSITAERVKRVIKGYGDVEGTGGDFSFYDLGHALLLPDGNINEDIDMERIREYVYFMETKCPMSKDLPKDNPYFLGKHNEAAYYFYYAKEHITTLDDSFLSTIRTDAEHYIIYADQCVFSPVDLQRLNIIFKKIPRDIAKL